MYKYYLTERPRSIATQPDGYKDWIDYDERTYIELLIVKHTLEAAEQMKTEGDFVSDMTDAEPPSCYVEV